MLGYNPFFVIYVNECLVDGKTALGIRFFVLFSCIPGFCANPSSLSWQHWHHTCSTACNYFTAGWVNFKRPSMFDGLKHTAHVSVFM